MRSIKKIGCIFALVLLNISTVQANSLSADVLTCGDVFANNSVVTTINGYESEVGDFSQVAPGEEFRVFGNISNENSFSITDVSVYARIFSINSDGTEDVFDLHSLQLLSDKLYLGPSQTVDVEGMSMVPSHLEDGEYYIDFYSESLDRFPLGEKEKFTTMANEGISVSVSGEGSPNFVTIDRSRTSIDNHSYSGVNIPIFTGTDDEDLIMFRTVVDNTEGSRPALGDFTWDIYAGDRINQTTRIDSHTKEIKLVPGTDTTLSYEMQDTFAHTHYTVVGTLSVGGDTSADSHIVMRVNTAEGATAPAAGPAGSISSSEPATSVVDPLNFFAFSGNPNSSTATQALLCYQSSVLSSVHEGRLEIIVANDGGVLGEFTTSSAQQRLELAGQDTSYGAILPIENGAGPFQVTTNIYSEDQIISSSTVDITCESNPDFCGEEYQPGSTQSMETSIENWLRILAVVTLLAILIGLLIGHKVRQRRKLSANHENY